MKKTIYIAIVLLYISSCTESTKIAQLDTSTIIAKTDTIPVKPTSDKPKDSTKKVAVKPLPQTQIFITPIIDDETMEDLESPIYNTSKDKLEDRAIGLLPPPEATYITDKPDVEAKYRSTTGYGFRDLVLDNFDYPKHCLENEIEGKVILQFNVNIDGTISNISPIKEINCKEATYESIRILRLSSGSWIPAQKNGKFVASRKAVDIEFRLPPEPEVEPVFE